MRKLELSLCKRRSLFCVIESFIKENNYQLISCYDFKEIFKVEVLALSYEGNLSDYIEGIIRTTFITNSDANKTSHTYK